METSLTRKRPESTRKQSINVKRVLDEPYSSLFAVAVIVIVGLIAIPSQLDALPVPPPDVPPLPTWTLVPRTASSVPLSTAVLPGNPPNLATVPLAAYGYVEEEYFISSTANIYTADGSAVVTPNVPYTSRILVRRPSNPQQWSGNVQVAPFRDQNEESEPWRGAWPYMLSHGDVFVGFTMARANVAAFFLPFDPVRYAPLNISDEGLRWDIMAQVAWLTRSPAGLLASLGFDINDIRVYSSGWSLTGRMQLTFLNNGYHARARTPSGGPVIDGYVAGIINTPLNIHPPDAAVIRVQSENEVATGGWAIRQADSDTPTDRFRLYELAGTSHADFGDQSQFTVTFFQLGVIPAVTVHCLQPVSDLPNKRHLGYHVTLANLDAWVRNGSAPPPGRVLELNPDNTIKRDVYGNAVGGVRGYWVQVPISSVVYRSDPDPADPAHGGQCGTMLHEVPFADATLNQLYRNHGTYVSQVTHVLNKLVADGYLLKPDAQDEKDTIVHADIP